MTTTDTSGGGEEAWLCGWKILQGPRKGQYCAKSARYMGNSLGKIHGRLPLGKFCKRHFLMLCKEKEIEQENKNTMHTDGDEFITMERGYVFAKHRKNIPLEPQQQGEEDEEPPSKKAKTNFAAKEEKVGLLKQEGTAQFEKRKVHFSDDEESDEDESDDSDTDMSSCSENEEMAEPKKRSFADMAKMMQLKH